MIGEGPRVLCTRSSSSQSDNLGDTLKDLGSYFTGKSGGVIDEGGDALDDLKLVSSLDVDSSDLVDLEDFSDKIESIPKGRNAPDLTEAILKLRQGKESSNIFI